MISSTIDDILSNYKEQDDEECSSVCSVYSDESEDEHEYGAYCD